MEVFLVKAVLAVAIVSHAQGLLYPRDSETRDVRRLDGIWKFKLCPLNDPDQGFHDGWYSYDWDHQQLTYDHIAVPSSYNDLSQNTSWRDHVGWAWYQTTFRQPITSSFASDSRRIVLNFASIHYNAVVFLNGQLATNHTGGHLPFEADVTSLLKAGSENVLTVAVNNTLTKHTIPQGSLTLKINDPNYPPFFYSNEGNFDFFNYAGIHRSVFLYSTSRIYIDDVTIKTLKADPSESIISYDISTSSSVDCTIKIYTKTNQLVAENNKCSDNVTIEDSILWYPYTFNTTNVGYMYSMHIYLKNKDQVVDHYVQKFGIRTVKIQGTQFLVNGEPFYFTGFGKHEDADIRGKGLDYALMIKDINLIKWLGANSFRTSHYPYSEELMDLCDENGIVVIDESPAVALDSFTDELKEFHKILLTKMVTRDKNRPSVFMWSLANEPQSSNPLSGPYFKDLVDHMRTLDDRPVTVAINADPSFEFAGDFLDVIMFNKYTAWYSDTGCLDVVERQVVNKYSEWFTKLGKPVMISEYGGDTIPGQHTSPSFVFTEDYQAELIIKHHRAFDTLRDKGWFIGEHIWNFADFMTAMNRNGITRVVGNRKGILTRDRQPKAAAKVIRCRYHRLANLPLSDDSYYCPPPYSGALLKDEL